MRSDLLSKRIYYAGCFGLPWLWIVHALYYWKLVMPSSTSTDGNRNDPAATARNNNNQTEGLLNPDDHFHDEPTTMTPEEIHIEALKWVNRCKWSASVVVTLWITWIVVAQVIRDQLPTSLFMLPPDSPQVTGW